MDKSRNTHNSSRNDKGKKSSITHNDLLKKYEKAKKAKKPASDQISLPKINNNNNSNNNNNNNNNNNCSSTMPMKRNIVNRSRQIHNVNTPIILGCNSNPSPFIQPVNRPVDVSRSISRMYIANEDPYRLITLPVQIMLNNSTDEKKCPTSSAEVFPPAKEANRSCMFPDINQRPGDKKERPSYAMPRERPNITSVGTSNKKCGREMNIGYLLKSAPAVNPARTNTNPRQRTGRAPVQRKDSSGMGGKTSMSGRSQSVADYYI